MRDDLHDAKRKREMRHRQACSQGTRAFRAMAALAVAIAVVVAMDSAFAMSEAQLEESAVSADSAAESLAGLRGVRDAYAVKAGDDHVATFEKELFSLADARDVLATPDGRIVGFTASEGAGSAFALIAQRLSDAGWTEVPSGAATIGSFVKSDGTLRWVFVVCSDMGGESSVVVQCA